MKWYQDDAGNTSALRLIVVPGAAVGAILILAGGAAMFLSLPAAGVAMTTGAGLISAAMGAKAWQKRTENGTPKQTEIVQ